jgi:transcriptional regulator with XRE-family HTH domain
MAYIGDTLRQLRLRRDLPQVRQATKANLRPDTIFQLENNGREPKPEIVNKLAEALSVEPSELADEE